ncbi:MAG: hypothetical protein PHI97_29450 [Desulfobulbus sp.]|nr:hypothetical protein [Desulfobulbus sp.]
MDHLARTAGHFALSACLLASLILPGTTLAEETENNPLRFYQSSNGKSYLQATLGVDLAFFSQDNAWYGNDRGVMGVDIDTWWESLIRPGLEGNIVLPNTQTLYGRIDAVQANTFEGYDAAGTNVGLGDVSSLRIDKAYLGWRSGNLFRSMGEDFLDISFGRQIYTAGTLFLFGSEGGAGFNRAAYYLGGRRSADFTAIAKFKSGPWSGDLFFFDNDSPFPANTQATGLTLDYAFSKNASIGGSLATLESDNTTRDEMRLYDIRGSIKPFAVAGGPATLQPLKLDGELVVEDRDDGQDNGLGWYVAASYQWADVAWKPELTYRYSSFDENYDVLFYSATDWGSWFQGEITGEYDIFNENQDTHMIRLKVQPVDALAVSLFYYAFSLHSPAALSVTSDDYVDEWNLTVDWTVNNHLSLSWVGAYAIPDSGAKQRFGDDEDWKAMMFWASIRY